MNASEIIDKMISEFGNKWDTYKPVGLSSLAHVGVDYKGVFKGDPQTITDFPCLSVLPSAENYEKTGNQYRVSVTFEISIAFYSYDVTQDDNIDKVLMMGDTIRAIIKNNRKLDNMVDVIFLSNVEYGTIIKAGFSGDRINVMGGVVDLEIKTFAEF